MADELEMVNRLLTRLALTEDSQLEKVLNKLLPYAISLMSTNNSATKVKLTEMLSHINKRVKEQLTIKLPMLELVKLYKGQETGPLVKNLSIFYIEMAFDRSLSEDKLTVVPDLLSGISSLPVAHRDVFLRLSSKAFEDVTSDRVYDSLASKLKESLSTADYPVLIEFTTLLMLYQPPSATRKEGDPPPVPAGVSVRQATRVTGKGHLSAVQLVGRKAGLLNLVSKLEVDQQVVYPMYLVAASDSNDQVSKRGDELLKRKVSGANLEDPALVKRLFAMFQGTLDNEQVPPDAKIPCATFALKTRIMSVFTHSIAACNSFPMTLQCIFDCLYGNATTNRLKQSGMEFTVWVFKHASNEQLKVMAPVILKKLVDFLGAEEIEPSLMSLRSFAFQAVGQLAQRASYLFSGDTGMIKLLFAALRKDNAPRFTIQESLSALATAYKNAAPAVKEDIITVLLEHIEAPEAEARFCVIFWAIRVFEPTHVQSRFLCILAANDSKLDIRELSHEGLNSGVYPSFQEMLSYICSKQPAILSPSPIGERILLFPAKVYGAMASYLLRCYEEIRANTQFPGDTLRLLLEHGMAYDGTVELHCLCSKGLLTLASQYPKEFGSLYTERIQWIIQFLGNIDPSTRQYMSQILGIVAGSLTVEKASELLHNLVSWLSKTRFEDVHGTICSIGYVLAQFRTGTPAVPEELQRKAVVALLNLLASDKFAGYAAESLGHAGLRCSLPLPVGDLTQLSKAPSEQVPAEAESLSALINQLKGLLSSKDTKTVQKSVLAFGHLCFGCPLQVLLDISVTCLSELRKSKVEDVLLSVGESLAFIWGVIPVTTDRILQSDFISLSHSTNFFEDDSTSSSPVDMQILEDSDERATSRDRIVSLLEELVYSSKKEERCAGSVWLLSLVSYCGHHPRIQALLPKFQEAFSYLLGEQNELTQEMASRGMSIVYELGDSATREELVKALVGTLSGTAKRKRPIKLMEDSEVFEKGAVGDAPSGGNISTYKELCNLANEMGQPDLVYKFMDLANYQTSLNSKRGAAFGFAKITKRAGDALLPHLRSLVPKLLRYQHDPNKNIQDAMGHIWKTIVAEPKKTIDQYFDEIMEDLITNAGSRFWRSRESSCMALADIIQGRKFSEVEKYLLNIWNMAFRAMDDIKESVRNAGNVLCRACNSLTTRLCDTSLTSEADARATIAIILPFLLSTGITSSVAEIRSTSIQMIMKLVKNAGQAIRGQLPDLVFCMLESLSSLEDQRLNYAEMHAERLGVSTEKLDNVRFSMAKDSPMWETLDLCLRQVDQQTLELLVPRLTQLVRSGVGLNTRAGVARFIALLAQQLGTDMKQYSSVLAKVLIPSVISERSAAVKRALAAAYAAVMKFSSERLLQQHFTEIVALYKTSDRDKRLACALLLKELSRQASDCMKNNYTLVLPVAFLARFDEDKSISSDFEEVWEENTSSQSVAVQLYMPEIIPLLIAGLESSSWTQKQQSAKAIIRVCEVAESAANPYAEKLLASLIVELRGRLWEGKECIMDAVAAVCTACSSVFKQSQELPPRVIVETIAAGCSRKKSSFRAAAFTCLEKVVRAFKGDDLFALVVPAFLEEISGNNPSENDKSSTDETSKSTSAWDKAFSCLTASLNTSSELTILPQAGDIIGAINKGLQANSWQVKLAALSCIREFVHRCPDGLYDNKRQEDTVSLILDCASNVRVAQVRISALECLKEVLTVLRARGKLVVEHLVDSCLRDLQNSEKSAAGRSLITDMVDLLAVAMVVD